MLKTRILQVFNRSASKQTRWRGVSRSEIPHEKLDVDQ